MRRFIGLLFGLFLAIIVGLIFECRSKNIKDQKLINSWNYETRNYFSNLKCSSLSFKANDIKFHKVFLTRDCVLWTKSSWELNFKNFIKSEKISSNITRNITEADVIVLIKVKRGDSYGRYSNGITAIGNNYEVNLINKVNKEIFKRKTFIGEGDPPRKISRKRNEKRNVYFGTIPYEEVIDFLYNEINN